MTKLIEKQLKANPGIIKEIAEGICQGSGSEREKVKRIQSWVHENISVRKHNEGCLTPPVKTIFDREADPRNTTILCAALCNAIGLEVIVQDMKNDSTLGVALDLSNDKGLYSYGIGGKYYYTIEPAKALDSEPENTGVGILYKHHQNLPLTAYPIYQDRSLSITSPDGSEHSIQILKDKFLHFRDAKTGRTPKATKAYAEKMSTYNNPIVSELSELLTRGLETNEEKAGSILNWVQENIKDSPDAYHGNDGISYIGNYARYPIETLFEKAGDTEDVTYLFTALCQAAEIEVAVITFPDHVMAGVKGDFKGIYFQMSEGNFYLADASAKSDTKVGVNPTKHKNAPVHVLEKLN